MSYQIKFTDQRRFPADVINVSDTFFNGPLNPSNPAYYTSLTGSANNANTTLTLAGRGVVDYGMPIQQGLVYMLEHFANYRSPVYPQPGQVWYKPRLRDTTPGNEEANVATDPPAIGLYIYRGANTPGGPKPGVWDPIPVSGQMFQPLDMSNGVTRQRITGVADPIPGAAGDYDAVNRLFSETNFVTKNLDDIKSSDLTITTGNFLFLESAPTIALHGTNKLYVDTTIASQIALNNAALPSLYLPLSGGTLSGDIVLPFDDISMGIGTITLTSGSINLPAGGSINIGVGNLTVSAGTFSAGGPSNFTGLSTFTNGVAVTNTLMSINNSQILLTGAASITGLALPTNPGDAANKQYVDNVAAALGADGVVTGGNVNPTTGVLTLNRTIGGDVAISGAVAPLSHTHQSTQVFHNADPVNIASFIRDQFINQPVWPNNITLQAVLDLMDDALSEISRPYDRRVIVSDGITATYSLNRQIRVGHNQLQVYVDGVKWIASQLAEGQIDVSPTPRTSDNTSLAFSTAYSFNLTVNGTLYTNFTITTPAGPDPINYNDLTLLIDAQLVALGVPAVCVISGGLIRIISSLAGAGSSVIIAAPSAGTNLLTSLSGATPVNDTISTTYSYYEVGLPYELSDQFTFTTIPPLNTTIELLTLTR